MTPAQRRWASLSPEAGFVAFYLWGMTGLPGFGNYPGPYGDDHQQHRRRADPRHRGRLGHQLRVPRIRHGGRGVHPLRRGHRGEHRPPPPEGRAGTLRRWTRPTAGMRRRPATRCGWWPSCSPGPRWWSAGTSPRTRRPVPRVASRAAWCWPPRSSSSTWPGSSCVFQRVSPVASPKPSKRSARAVRGHRAQRGGPGAALSEQRAAARAHPGAVDSSGTIALISFFVGLEVAAAFVLIVGELLEQTLLIRQESR